MQSKTQLFYYKHSSSWNLDDTCRRNSGQKSKNRRDNIAQTLVTGDVSPLSRTCRLCQQFSETHSVLHASSSIMNEKDYRPRHLKLSCHSRRSGTQLLYLQVSLDRLPWELVLLPTTHILPPQNVKTWRYLDHTSSCQQPIGYLITWHYESEVSPFSNEIGYLIMSSKHKFQITSGSRKL